MFHLLQLVVDWSIDFHTKPDGRAVKIEDIRSDRMLPAKPQAALVPAEQSPNALQAPSLPGAKHAPV